MKGLSCARREGAETSSSVCLVLNRRGIKTDKKKNFCVDGEVMAVILLATSDSVRESEGEGGRGDLPPLPVHTFSPSSTSLSPCPTDARLSDCPIDFLPASLFFFYVAAKQGHFRNLPSAHCWSARTSRAPATSASTARNRVLGPQLSSPNREHPCPRFSLPSFSTSSLPPSSSLTRSFTFSRVKYIGFR